MRIGHLSHIQPSLFPVKHYAIPVTSYFFKVSDNEVSVEGDDATCLS